MCWKVETSSSEAKIVRIGAESLKALPSRPEKGTSGLPALEGKIGGKSMFTMVIIIENGANS